MLNRCKDLSGIAAFLYHNRAGDGGNRYDQAAADAADGNRNQFLCKGLTVDHVSQRVVGHILDEQRHILSDIDVENGVYGCRHYGFADGEG